MSILKSKTKARTSLKMMEFWHWLLRVICAWWNCNQFPVALLMSKPKPHFHRHTICGHKMWRFFFVCAAVEPLLDSKTLSISFFFVCCCSVFTDTTHTHGLGHAAPRHTPMKELRRRRCDDYDDYWFSRARIFITLGVFCPAHASVVIWDAPHNITHTHTRTTTNNNNNKPSAK